MIVVAILGVLIFVLQDSYSRWAARYRVENAVKTLHAHMTAARGRAMARNRVHFLRIDGAASYEVVEDTSPAPDGNETLEVGSDTRVAQGDTALYPFTLMLNGAAATQLAFNRDGTAAVAPGTANFIRLTPDPGTNPDYDCIDIAPTRLKPGRFIGGTCVPQ